MTTVSSGQTLTISAGQTSSGVVVLSGGFLDVLSGGTTLSTTVDNGGVEQLDGGVASLTTVSSGGSQFVFSGGKAISATIIGISNSGGEQDVFSGGVASFTTVNGGLQFVSSGATAVGTVVSNSGFQGVDGGTASLTTVDSGSFQDTFLGGTAISTTVSSGGNAGIASGGTASGAIIDPGGVMVVNSGGTASDTTVNSGGVLAVVPGATDNALNAQAGAVIVSSGVTIFTASNSEAGLTLVSGPVATLSGITVSGPGVSGIEAVFALPGGTVSNANLDGRGVLVVVSGGVAVGTIVSSSAEVLVGGRFSTSADGRDFPGGVDSNSTILGGGLESVANGGVASSTTVDSGGQLTISSAGTAVAPVLSGGTVELGTGGVVSGGITFSGSGGRLQIDGTAMPSSAISGFTASGDLIDLTGLAFSGNTSVAFNSATDVLTLVEGGGTATIQLDSETYTGLGWVAQTDAGSGTDIAVACYCRGTRILIKTGEVAVEELAIGDEVMTLSGEAKPIKWIGRRAYDPRFVAANRTVLPIRIEAGALAEGLPARDLWLSPEHALYIDDALAPAGLLVNGITIRQVESVERLEYFHIELGTHDVILAEGAPAETFVDCDNRAMFHNGAEFAALYPDDTPAPWQFCAPRVEPGSAELRAIRAALLLRAEALGRVTGDPDVHLVVDGEIVRAQAVEDGVYSFTIPAGSGAVWLASRSAVPAEADPSSQDRRRLGVALKGVVLRDADLRSEIWSGHASLREGVHDDEGGHRWTDGMARLPKELLRPFGGGVTLEVHLIENGLRYPRDMPDAITRRRRYRRSA